jgi:hypothetical protein
VNPEALTINSLKSSQAIGYLSAEYKSDVSENWSVSSDHQSLTTETDAVSLAADGESLLLIETTGQYLMTETEAMSLAADESPLLIETELVNT